MDLKEYLPQIKAEEAKEKRAIDWIFSKFVEQGRINVFRQNIHEIEEAVENAYFAPEFDEHYSDICELIYGEKREGSFLEMILEEVGVIIERIEVTRLGEIEEDDIKSFDIEEDMLQKIEEYQGQGIIILDSCESAEAYKEIFKETKVDFLEITNGVLITKDYYDGYENLIYVSGDQEKLSILEEAWGNINSVTGVLGGIESTVLMIMEYEGQYETWDLNDTVQSFVKHGLINIPYTIQTNNIVVSAWNAIELIKRETKEVIL